MLSNCFNISELRMLGGDWTTSWSAPDSLITWLIVSSEIKCSDLITVLSLYYLTNHEHCYKHRTSQLNIADLLTKYLNTINIRVIVSISILNLLIN